VILVYLIEPLSRKCSQKYGHFSSEIIRSETFLSFTKGTVIFVTDGVKGMCVDPGEMEAILKAGKARGPGPPGGEKGGQLPSDSGGR
jgi:hypothetical protein